MNMNWDSLLEPIFLFILSLIAGTLWVIIPTDPKHDAAAAIKAQTALLEATAEKAALEKAVIEKTAAGKKPETGEQESAEAKAATARALQTALAEAKANLSSQEQALLDAQRQVQEQSQQRARIEQQVKEQVQQQAGLTAQELDQLQQENRQRAQEVLAEQRTLENLQSEMHTLEQQVVQARAAQLAQVNQDAVKEARTMRGQLEKKREEEGRLRAQLESAAGISQIEFPYVPTADVPTKLPVLVEFIHNRVVPVNKDAFRIQAKLSGPSVAKRFAEGENIADIRKDSSAFAKFLAKLRPDKEYLSCLLNGDSYEIFREARRIAQLKGIDVGWEPADTSSGEILIYPARLTTKNEVPKAGAKLPRVARIMH